MRCSEVMKTNIACCSPDDPVVEAATMMRDENVGFIPICDDSRKVQGTLTDRDIAIRLVAERRGLETPCRDVMTKKSVSCMPEQDLRDALEQMKRHHVARILCVDGAGTLVGVISLSDIAQQASNRRVADAMRGVTEREAHLH